MAQKNDENSLKHKLQFTENKLNLIYQNSPLAFISWSNNGQIKNLNQAAVRLLGWEQEELTNQKFISTIIAEKDREIWSKFKNEKLEYLPQGFMSRTLKKMGLLLIVDGII